MAGGLLDQETHLLLGLKALLENVRVQGACRVQLITSLLKSLPVSLSLTLCTISSAFLLRASGSTDSPLAPAPSLFLLATSCRQGCNVEYRVYFSYY